MTQLCECDSFDCDEEFETTIEQLMDVRTENPRAVFIAKTCKVGPSPGDKLLDEGSTFFIYEDADAHA